MARGKEEGERELVCTMHVVPCWKMKACGRWRGGMAAHGMKAPHATDLYTLCTKQCHLTFCICWHSLKRWRSIWVHQQGSLVF